MDKNTLVGFALIGAVVIGFSIYNRPSQEEMARAKHYQDSIQAIAQKEAAMQEQAAAQQNPAHTIQADSTSLLYGASQGTEQLTTLENDLVKVTFTNKGGRVCAAMLKDYNGQDGKPLELFDEKDSGMNFAFEGKNENILTEDLYFQPTNVTDTTVTMRLTTNGAGYIDFDYKLLPNTYVVNFSIRANGMQNFFPAAANTVNINWHQRARQLEKGFSFEQRYTSLTYKPVNKGSDYLSEMKDAKEEVTDRLDWIAFKNQFFSSVLIADQDFDKASLVSTPQKEGSGYMKNYTADMTTFFDPTGKQATNMQFYFGPNRFKTLLASNDLSLSQKDLELEDLVYLGWPIIRWINRWYHPLVRLAVWLGTEHGYSVVVNDHYRKSTGISGYPQVIYVVCQDARIEALYQRNQCQISQKGGCAEEATGNNGTLQQIRCQSDGRLSAYADSNAGIHGLVLLCAKRHRAAPTEFLMGSRYVYLR